MNKEEFIKRYGEKAWLKILERHRDWKETHKEEIKEQNEGYRETHKEEITNWGEENKEEQNKQRNQKGGKYYEENLSKNRTGLRGERGDVRHKHGHIYLPYKKIIDPEGLTQLHHQWTPNTANYRGVALVEKDQHMHGFIDVIQLLEGEITLLTEAETRNNEEMSE